MIEVRDLTKSYGAVEALRGLTFSVPRGQVVGLLGPNGAGKTTAMRILTGYVAPTSGSAKVGGLEVIEDPVACQRRVGYLPEGNPLYTDFRIDEALRFVAEMFGLRGAERASATAAAVHAAGLTGMERRVIGTLSKGYRQRVGLAQALMHSPEVLILDEPTSGLDPNQQEEMRELIRSLGRERTVVLSTHILPEVEAVCHRALIIHRGQLVADGTVDEIKAQAAGGSVVVVAVRGSADAAEAAFRDLEFVRGLSTEPAEAPGIVEVLIRTDTVPQPAHMEAIAARASARSLPLSRLTARTATLEQIFAQLTVGNGPAAPAVREG